MKTKTTPKKGIFGKIVAGVTAGATLGLATYMYLKKEKLTLLKNEKFALTKELKESMFV